MSQKETDWRVVAALPNIDVSEPIDGQLAALTPYDDVRVVEACSAQPLLRGFLERFTDAFGDRIRPSILIVRQDAPASISTVNAVASFRDVIALSTVVLSRAFLLNGAFGPRAYFSDSFWLYPWMLDRSGQGLTTRVPAMFGSGYSVSKFKGQCLPELPVCKLDRSQLDESLLNALFARWRKAYSSRLIKDILLFRSLNMAYQAAKSPAGTDTTLFDYGRSLVLWVSAFEVLAHPGVSQSGVHTVYGLLGKVDWQSRELKARRYLVYPKSKAIRRTLACKLYGEVYEARNRFLHGNNVSSNTLRLTRTDSSLFHYAAPLYRMALTGYLPLSFSGSVPSLDEPRVFGAHVAERMRFYDPQKAMERALLTART